jgi:SAM-dependent methyltransferase
VRQVRHAVHRRQEVGAAMAVLLEQVRRDDARIADALGRPVDGLDILEIGPGQNKERAYYFGARNRVTAIDLDVIPGDGRVGDYWRMYRANGWGRVVKTVGGYAIIGRRARHAWADALGVRELTEPGVCQGDICQAAPAESRYDVVTSWSVLEHLPDPASALRNVVTALRPGGALFLSIHLYTSNDGHHDIRSFTGTPLPPWAHLRPSTLSDVRPSAYLNEWRLRDWRALFDEVTPGAREYLDQYELPEVLGPLLDGDIGRELAGYDAEELLTVNTAYAWRKPRPDTP